jgi:hypothetical protein
MWKARIVIHLLPYVKHGFHCALFAKFISFRQSSVPNFIEIGLGMYKIGQNSFTPLSEACFQLHRFSRNSHKLYVGFIYLILPISVDKCGNYG